MQNGFRNFKNTLLKKLLNSIRMIKNYKREFEKRVTCAGFFRPTGVSCRGSPRAQRHQMLQTMQYNKSSFQIISLRNYKCVSLLLKFIRNCNVFK